MHRPQKHAVKLWLPKDSDKTDTRSALSALHEIALASAAPATPSDYPRLHVETIWKKAKEEQEPVRAIKMGTRRIWTSYLHSTSSKQR